MSSFRTCWWHSQHLSVCFTVSDFELVASPIGQSDERRRADAGSNKKGTTHEPTSPFNADPHCLTETIETKLKQEGDVR